MDDDKGSTFTPPTPQQWSDHLRRYSPRRARRWVTMLPFIGLGVVVGLAFASNSLVSIMFPVLVLAALLVGLNMRVRLLRRVEWAAGQVQELSALRRHGDSLARGWLLLPKLRQLPEAHSRTVAAMTMSLDQVKAYESAAVGYDYLLAMLPEDHPGAVQLSIQRAVAHLMSDRLTDADDALRRIRGTIDRYDQTPIAAGYRLAGLIQQVHTNHFADAVAESTGLVESLRPLGVDAGFGYALMALSCFMADPSQADASDSPARSWWARATTLLLPSVLIDRFEPLQQIAHLPATPLPEPLTSR